MNKRFEWAACAVLGAMLLGGCGDTKQPGPVAKESEAGSTPADANKQAANGAAANGHAAEETKPAKGNVAANGHAEAAPVATAGKIVISPGPDAQAKAQEAFILAENGATIEFAEGKFDLTATLSVEGKENITIKGQGIDKTILDFSGQKKGTGGEGLKVSNAKNFTLAGMTIQNTPGDAFKPDGCDMVKIQHLRTTWTNGPSPENGAYGIYPVLSKNVLVEHCVAECASDAGVYVGQSENVIVRHNRAEKNVAGIEIENCIGADVYENDATGNTGGLLVFSLPGLKLKNGKNCRVYNNRVYENNLDNFAKAGNMVAGVPAGTGLMIMANDNVEVFKNEIRDHKTGNLSIISFFTTQLKFDDAEYDPYPEGISIHDNTFGPGGDSPQAAAGQVWASVLGGTLPDIVYDGIIDEKKLVDGKLPAELGIAIVNNGDADFANADLGAVFAQKEPQVQRDLAAHGGTLAPLPPVSIAGVE